MRRQRLMIRPSLPLSVLIAALGTLVGCGQKSGGNLHGSVTYNGQPLNRGSIMFTPVSTSTAAFGAAIVNGEYVAEKAVPGEFTAIVRGILSPVPATRAEADALAARPGGAKQAMVPENAEGNNLKVQVSGDDQTLDFALKGPPG